MAVTQIQKQPKKPTAVTEKSVLETTVERVIFLKGEIDKVKAYAAEYEKLRKGLALKADEMVEADQPAVFESALGKVVFTPKTSERTITDMPGVFAKIGQENFLKLCAVPMKEVDAYIALTEQEALVTEARTGSRKISVEPNLVAEA